MFLKCERSGSTPSQCRRFWPSAKPALEIMYSLSLFHDLVVTCSLLYERAADIAFRSFQRVCLPIIGICMFSFYNIASRINDNVNKMKEHHCQEKCVICSVINFVSTNSKQSGRKIDTLLNIGLMVAHRV